ncbi:hypothetical protein [Agreia pratensis]|uniref:Uncharacterized protein n=1 Tax=Agreia pratensis TaxID=150121 RepID=A0A1X7L889_9MICO|nr:hypothetical protein [Agreia pratensis]SMG49767.1 hypothetical protein SAMN06296010_3439 [Agreia pratensis]
MNSYHQPPLRPVARPASRRARLTRRILAVAAGAAVLALASLTAIAPPPPPSQDELLAASSASGSTASEQVFDLPAGFAQSSITRDSVAAVPGVQGLAQGRTNRDWAELVLLLGDFPRTDDNITVMMRWMRQENGPDDWWNRNNPLNNGWGSGGNSGLGSYDNLVIAAENAAEALRSNPGYSAIVAGFSSSAPTAQIEQAIWASPWATSHYANGSHWSYTPVPVIESPAGTW